MPASCLTEPLATFAVETRFCDLPAAAQTHAVDALVNWVGCAVGGGRHATVEIAAEAFKSISPEGRHRVLGRGDRHGIVEAISLDCLSSAVLAFDDTHLETVLHPTGPVAAALLGIARERPVRGEDFAVALSVGMEVQCRVGLAFTAKGSGAKQGWYATGIAGGIGAAAAVGRLLSFDPRKTVHAMGIAAARASGTRGTHGSMTAQYVPSMAAESGYIAAKMAAAGFECGARALDGDSGLLDLIASTPQTGRALQDLGRISEAAKTAFKPYPSGIVTHPVIDACLELMSEHHIRAGDIDSVAFDVSPTARTLGAKRRPRDLFAAQVSLSYWAAGTLATGAANLDLMSTDMLHDPAVHDLEDRLSFTADPALLLGQCRAAALTRDGRAITVSIEQVTGSEQRPMTSEQVDGKFRSLTVPILDVKQTEQLLSLCRSVNEQADVSALLASH